MTHADFRTATISALVGLAIGGSTATGAGVTLLFSVDATQANVGETITWTVSAQTTGLDVSGYFGGFVGSFRATNADAYNVSNITPLMQGIGTTPTSTSGSINTINMFHSALLGTDDNANPLPIMTFDVVVGAGAIGRRLEYSADGVASLFASDFIFELPIEIDDFQSVSDVFLVFPATPSAAVLLGGCAIAARRRRG